MIERQAAAPAERLTTIAAGGYHTCGLRPDGTAVCWGANAYGQSSPPGGSYVAIAAGAANSCALDGQGAISCWGSDYYGQSSPPKGAFTSLALGPGGGCGIRKDGAMVCWGTPARCPPPRGKYRQVVLGTAHGCATRVDGKTVCWWYSAGNEEWRPPAEGPRADERFVRLSVSTSGGHVCGLHPDHTVRCWGANHGGQARAPRGKFLAVTAGSAYSCGVREEDRKVVCWGETYSDVLRSSGPGNVFHPLDGAYADVRGGDKQVCGLRPDGTVRCRRFPDAVPYQPQGTYLAIDVAFHGARPFACGLRRDTREITCWDGPPAPPGRYERLSLGNGIGCALTAGGEVRCWGSLMTRVRLPAGEFVDVTAGTSLACGVRRDSTITCWGLAAGARWPVPRDDAYSALDLGSEAACALTKAGKARCFGPKPPQ
jgi:hypothetical protein